MPDLRFTAEEEAAYRAAPPKSKEKEAISRRVVDRLRQENPGVRWFVPGWHDTGSDRTASGKPGGHSLSQRMPQQVTDPWTLLERVLIGDVEAYHKDHGNKEWRQDILDLVAFTADLLGGNNGQSRRRLKKG